MSYLMLMLKLLMDYIHYLLFIMILMIIVFIGKKLMVLSIWWFPWGDWKNGTWGMGWMWGFWMNGTNMLKTRLLADKVFKAMYDSIYEQVQKIALNTEFTENFFTTWTNALLNYNEDNELIEKDAYLKAVETIRSKIEDKRED